MKNYQHKHFYRLWKRWNSPRGYVFTCEQCKELGLYYHEFRRDDQYWVKQPMKK